MIHYYPTNKINLVWLVITSLASLLASVSMAEDERSEESVTELPELVTKAQPLLST